MLGGGTWTMQNKILPGSYINFKSTSDTAQSLAERGTVAYLVNSSWGSDVNIITAQEFANDSLKLLGYDYMADEMLPYRELFRHAQKAVIVNASSGGVNAGNTFATAKFKGTCGNSLKTVIEVNEGVYAVTTLYGTDEVDTQYVTSASELVSNDFCDFKSSATLAATAGTAFTGGTNGTVTSTTLSGALGTLEAHDFNVLCSALGDDYDSQLVSYTKRMRDDYGIRFQFVYTSDENPEDDDESIIWVQLRDVDGEETTDGLEWTAGALAGCALGESLTNKLYDGEITTLGESESSQIGLEGLINSGVFAFHRVHGSLRVLKDLNSLTTVSTQKGEAFKSNQVIRVCDTINNGVRKLFDEKYMGLNPNNKAGRSALWADIVAFIENIETQNAIEDFSSADVTVEQGEKRTDVVVNVWLSPVYALERLYMTVYINQ